MQQVSRMVSKGNYSKDYGTIRTNAEKNWPQWKKEYYNDSFAKSSHAIKFELKEPKK